MKIDRELTRPSDKWFSERGIPLITQPLGLPKMTEKIISVERYEKWYDIYVADPTTALPAAVVTREIFPEYGISANDMWRDHCLVPDEFIQFVKAIGAKVDLQTYDAICRRYIQDWVSRNAVFTREFCEEMMDWKQGTIRENCFDVLDYPTTEDLHSVLVEHDLLLTI